MHLAGVTSIQPLLCFLPRLWLFAWGQLYFALYFSLTQSQDVGAVGTVNPQPTLAQAFWGSQASIYH